MECFGLREIQSRFLFSLLFWHLLLMFTRLYHSESSALLKHWIKTRMLRCLWLGPREEENSFWSTLGVLHYAVGFYSAILDLEGEQMEKVEIDQL